MKTPRLSFDQLQIDGFGHFHEFKVELSPGLNVLYGDNGVGKSTLMAFVRSVLFGFARRNTPERYQTQGAFGGRLLLSTPHGELWVQRLDGKRAEGELTVKNGVMAAVPESRLREALASVDRDLFEQVFAFGLDELRSWGQLMDAGKVKDALAAASMQGALRLPHALEKLDADARVLWGKQATTRQLNVALQELAQVRARRLQLGDRPKEYFATRALLEASALEADRVQQAYEAARDDEFLLERLLQAAPHVERAVEAAAQLAVLPNVERFPESGLVRLDEAQLQQQAAAAACARADVNARALSARLDQAKAALTGRAPLAPIAAAVDGWRQLASLDAELDERRAESAQRELRLADQVQRLGLSSPLSAIDASASARVALTAVRSRALQTAERTARASDAAGLALGRREEAQRAVGQLEAELSLLGGDGPVAVPQALEAARALAHVEQQARVVEAQLEDRHTALAAAAVPDEPAPLERWPLWLVAAIALVLLALAGSAFGLAGFGVGVAALAFALALSGLLITVHHKDHSHWLSARSAHQAVQRHRHEHRERLTAELQVARSRLAALQQQLAQLRAVAGAVEGASGARLAELERLAGAAGRSAELTRDLAVARARLQSALDDEAHAEGNLTLVAAETAAARSALQAQLKKLGLPESLEASGALELLAEVALAQEAARALSDLAASLERDAQRVGQAAAALELAAQQARVSGATAAQLVAALVAWLEKGAALQGEVAALGARCEDAAAALAAAKADAVQAQGRVDALLAAAHASDPEEFRRLGAAFGLREQRVLEARHADARVKAACGLCVEVAHAQLLLAPGLEARLEAARNHRLALEAQRRDVHEQRGALAQKLTAWEADAQLGPLLQHEQLLTARAEELARRFAVARLGHTVLSKAREKFEAEHQPQVVQRAGQLFRLLTGGKYPRLVIDTADSSLQTIDSQGRSFSVEQLSRGTREQLLTSLRLALIEDIGRDRLALPVMVDDVLVNFDPHRAARMVEALAELARRHQVLAFTCHPQTRELFKEYGAKAIEVSTRAQLALLPS